MMKVFHRYGPCSPMSHRQNPSHEQILNQDQARVDSIHRRSSAATSKPENTGDSLAVSIPAQKGIFLGSLNYVVAIGIGTPQKSFYVEFDTGSDLTWVQCEPCIFCHQQQDPLYDPAQSSTYRNLSCGSNNPQCRYTVKYVDGSQTSGFLVQDILTLTPSEVMSGFIFGCGNLNIKFERESDGLLGLGREKLSLVSQSTSKYGGVFSYCLPPSTKTIGYLKLGGSAPSNVRFTPMVTNSNQPSFYFLDLVAISVGGQQLSVPPTVFSNAGTVLDSGSVISRLPPTAYSALRSAFRQMMAAYPPAPPLTILDTCYNFTGFSSPVRVPSVALQFRNGLSLDLNPVRVFYVPRLSQACLAFAANDDDSRVGIIGNVQQGGFDVVYDIPNLQIGFGAGNCG